jgi:hypothetical protein
VNRDDDDFIWGMRLDADHIQVTIGSGDRGFRKLSNNQATTLAEDLGSPDHSYELAGVALSLPQQEELAATIWHLLRPTTEGTSL